jgi:hypothetical protein
MEESGKQIAEMQNVAGIGAALIELGGERPAYAQQQLAACDQIVGVVDQLDNAIASRSALADELRSLHGAHQEATNHYCDICKQVDWLFRAAMRAVIEKRINLEFLELVKKNQLFDQDIVAQYGLTATQIDVHDYELAIKGMICGTEFNPNPYQHIMGLFSADFFHDDNDGYSLYRYWSNDELDTLLIGVFLDDLPAAAENVEMLKDIKAWLDSFVTVAQLSRD